MHASPARCRLRIIDMRDYQESVNTSQTDRWTDRQTPDKVIPMCRYASQATQKPISTTIPELPLSKEMQCGYILWSTDSLRHNLHRHNL